jgi:hypothetical protein
VEEEDLGVVVQCTLTLASLPGVEEGLRRLAVGVELYMGSFWFENRLKFSCLDGTYLGFRRQLI